MSALLVCSSTLCVGTSVYAKDHPPPLAAPLQNSLLVSRLTLDSVLLTNSHCYVQLLVPEQKTPKDVSFQYTQVFPLNS